MVEHLLVTVITLIAAGVFVVGVLKRFNLSPVIGYLIAGAVIGDNGLKIVTSDKTSLLGEFGVVFLLFAIGLELSIERLKAMRKYVFGLGTLQVLITTIIISGAVVLFNQNSKAAIIIGGGLALSSTALVIQVLEENRSQSSQVGRISLAILLLQDVVVVPLLVMIPILAGHSNKSMSSALGLALGKAVLALLAIFIAGRLLLRPLFSLISTDGSVSNELPISMTLLVVLSAAWGTEYFGLSLALGAFVAGVLVAETDFRQHAEESIYPFKSLLLGLFFMTVGMKIDVYEIYSQLHTILTISMALIVVKTLIIAGLCILFGFNKGVAFHSGLLLSQGGEFAFILFNLAADKNNAILDIGTANILLLVVTCTMALTPLLSILGQKIVEMLGSRDTRTPSQIIEYGSRDLVNHAIIAGFGQVGKMIARVLEAEGINYIVIDVNNDLVSADNNKGFGRLFKGDISQSETLKALGIERSLAVILTMNNEITIKKALKNITSSTQSQLDIIIRLKNLKKSSDFYQLGATIIIPEDYETGLQIGGALLRTAGISEYEIARVKEEFRAGNYIIPKREDNLLEIEEND